MEIVGLHSKMPSVRAHRSLQPSESLGISVWWLSVSWYVRLKQECPTFFTEGHIQKNTQRAGPLTRGEVYRLISEVISLQNQSKVGTFLLDN